MRKVAIFLNQCLPLSEIFIAHQAKTLRRFETRLVACRKAHPSAEIKLPQLILNKGNSIQDKIEEALFKLTGQSRFFESIFKSADIVHAHFGPSGWLASGPAERAKRPLIVTLHGFDVLKRDITIKKDGLLQFLYARNRHILARRASAFICVSEYVKKRAIEFGFPAEKCHVLYMGIPLGVFKEAKAARSVNDPIHLFAAGRLVPFKGHEKLIEAVSIVQKAGYHVSLEIAGDGPLRSSLEEKAAQMLHNYKFHGAVSYAKMMVMMRNSDIFCHTSMHMENGQTEAFGLVVAEAQWAGVPVVAFDSGGVPEAMQKDITGILCKEGDVHEFAKAIISLIEDPDKRNAMADAAPRFIRDTFDIRVQTEKLEKFYDTIIDGFKPDLRRR